MEVQREDVWLTRSASVYVAFLFTNEVAPAASDVARDSDVLTEIVLYRLPGGD